MKLHHVGFAVRELEPAEAAFAYLGHEIGERTPDAGRQVWISWAVKDGVRVELVAPLTAGSPIDGVLEKVGPGAYHLCYQVPDITAAIKDLRKRGYLPLSPPSPAPAIGGANVVFLYSRVLGLIELVELPDEGESNG